MYFSYGSKSTISSLPSSASMSTHEHQRPNSFSRHLYKLSDPPSRAAQNYKTRSRRMNCRIYILYKEGGGGGGERRRMKWESTRQEKLLNTEGGRRKTRRRIGSITQVTNAKRANKRKKRKVVRDRGGGRSGREGRVLYIEYQVRIPANAPLCIPQSGCFPHPRISSL